MVGRFDSRFLGRDQDDACERLRADPSEYGIDGAFAAGINDYFSRDLKIVQDRPYKQFRFDILKKWNWKKDDSWQSKIGYPAVGVHLANGLRHNKDMRIFVANGYYDLATPFFGTEYSLSQYGMDSSRVTMKYYEAGHMMYIHHPSLEALTGSVRQFIQNKGKTD